MGLSMSPPTAPAQRLDLPIEGMSCAACAVRVERGLNKLEGVEATVNYATERASVRFDAGRVTPDELVAAVEAAGYAARLPGSAPVTTDDAAPALRLRLAVAAVLSAPVLALAMIPALQFDYWQWLSLALATPVVLWAGLALPSRCLAEPAASRGDHGHAHLARHADALGLVADRALLPRRRRGRSAHAVRARHRARCRRRHDLLRGGGGRHDLHAARALSRGARPAPLRRGAARAARAGRQGRRGARRRGPRAADPHRRAAGRRPLRRAAGREGGHRRRRRGGLLGGRPGAPDRRVDAGREAPRR